ncbi:MAG: carbohydrate ABC transporter permease [Oscillospiraceae bacterium]|nr:carbohydrate ABC transporter permease [Oscillospiraceae bacterium]
MITKQERRYQHGITATIMILVVLTLSPFVLLLMSSISSESSLIRNGYQFWPQTFSLDAYKYILRNSDTILKAYGLTIATTAVGTLMSLFLTITLAYPLSRKSLKGRNVITFLIFFTMLFHGGVVPSYILWARYLRIKNTFWALVLPNLLINPFHLILMKNYFEHSIPNEIMEAAELDGAGPVGILSYVVLPMGKPIIATVAMFTILTYWNDWTNALYFVSDSKLWSLQILLQNILNNVQFLSKNSQVTSQIGMSVTNIPSVSVRMAIAVLGVLPILILFPFFQKYIVKGISLGAVKE